MAKRTTAAELRERLTAAGWAELRPGVWRNTLAGRPTPDLVRASTYPFETFDSHTFLTFAVRDGMVSGQVLHGDCPAPWAGRSDAWISQARAWQIVADSHLTSLRDGVLS